MASKIFQPGPCCKSLRNSIQESHKLQESAKKRGTCVWSGQNGQNTSAPLRVMHQSIIVQLEAERAGATCARMEQNIFHNIQEKV
jgi:hypothetical protein